MNFYKKCLLVTASVLSASSAALAHNHNSAMVDVGSYLKISTVEGSNREMRTIFSICIASANGTTEGITCKVEGNASGYTQAELVAAERQLQHRISHNLQVRIASSVIGLAAGGVLGNMAIRSLPLYKGNLDAYQQVVQAAAIVFGATGGGAAGYGVGALIADSFGNLEIQLASRDALAGAQSRSFVIADQADGRLNEMITMITTLLMSIDSEK